MLEDFIEDWRRDSLDDYRRNPVRGPALVREHVGIEQQVLAGGYGYRQVVEDVTWRPKFPVQELRRKGGYGKQLRDRVGRGALQSHCVLLYHAPLTAQAHDRLALIH